MSKEIFRGLKFDNSVGRFSDERDYITSPKTGVTLGVVAGATSVIEILKGYRIHGALGIALSAVLLTANLPEYRSQRRMWKQVNKILEGGE